MIALINVIEALLLVVSAATIIALVQAVNIERESSDFWQKCCKRLRQ